MLKNFMKFFYVFALLLFGEDVQFEGIFYLPEKLSVAALFLPLNPSGVIYNQAQGAAKKYKKIWPDGKWLTLQKLSSVQDYQCDFLWIDFGQSQPSILHPISKYLKEIAVIYTTIGSSYYRELCEFLHYLHFQPIAHWFDNVQGDAIFIKQPIFDSVARTLNYVPNHQIPSSPTIYQLDPFFRSCKDKNGSHAMRNIDFIYMINLDERPEKFELTSFGLQLFGIHPYRFSAVNGWKLPFSTLEEIGVKKFAIENPNFYMGSIFRKINEREYQTYEFIQSGKTYFSLGISRGAVGIVLSHLSVLKDAYDSKYQTIWVMEDDVEILSSPNEIPDLIEKLDLIDPEWDILFTDPDTKDTLGRSVPCRALAFRPNFHIEPLSSFFTKFYSVSPEFSRTGMRYGAYSMVIRHSGMKKILDYYNSYGVFLPYDMDFWLIPNLKMYSVNKEIVSHRAGSLSDNGRPNYKLSNEDIVFPYPDSID